jgi:hypothetical protein
VLDDPAAVEHVDPVGRADAREAVRDEENRPALEQLAHAVEELGLGTRVERGRRGVAEEGAGERDALPVADREVSAAPELAAEHRVVPLGQRPQERIGARAPGRRHDRVFVVDPLVAAEPDVLARREQ